MVRPATWIASLSIGCLAWTIGPVARAEQPRFSAEPTAVSEEETAEPTPAEPTPADEAEAPESAEAADDTSETAATDRDADSSAAAEDATAEESASEGTAADVTATESDDSMADEAPIESRSAARAESATAAPEKVATEIIKERFPTGAVKIEREVTQDSQGNYVNHGIWKMFDQAGNLLAQGNYVHGQRAGTWIRWYRSVTEAELLSKIPYQQFAGPFISQATFKDDQLEGEWTIFDGRKHKISEWKFVNGQRHGASTWYYPNGRKLREIDFRDGDMDGNVMEWTSEAKLTLKDTYQAGRKLAAKVSQHQGGAKKSQGIYLLAKEVEQSPDDWWTCKLRTTVKTGKDEKHGPWISWHTNGQKQLEGTYEHDMQVGLFTWWHSNGQKALEGHFDQGKQDGEWVWWFASGQKYIRGEYAHGNPTGRWTWWKDDGKVAQAADLSQSEGVVIDVPRMPETAPATAQKSKPLPRQSIKR